jgi:hypothetical protein
VVAPLRRKLVLFWGVGAVQQYHYRGVGRVSWCDQATVEDLEDGPQDADLKGLDMSVLPRSRCFFGVYMKEDYQIAYTAIHVPSR